ncbi:Transcriptional regulator SlyA [Frankliniella fusca]|uniref:Transcriptional regulator SlyA n=1 Tax=Frankliniella fusca TaxID=407009 RepID=A0AAE1HY09_9NEOP|nr:Transcriptional regulator SlyA [Frankliniella fusca]
MSETDDGGGGNPGSEEGKAAEREKAFWEGVSLRTKISVPADLQAMLTAMGSNTEAALKRLNNDTINNMQDWARRILSQRLKPESTKKLAFGYFADDPNTFEFSPGQRDTLLELGVKMQNLEGKSMISPNLKLQSRYKNKVALCDDDQQIIAEQHGILSRIIDAALSRDFLLKKSEENTFYVLSLKSTL